MKNLVKNPWFWGGTALIVFAYFSAKGGATEAGAGVETALPIIAIGGGAALIIYAVNKGAAA